MNRAEKYIDSIGEESNKEKVANAILDAKSMLKKGMSDKEILKSLDPDIPKGFLASILKKAKS